MKMMSICAVVMCLAMQGLPSTPIGWLDVLLDGQLPEQDVERFREDFKDAKKLRECMVRLVGSHPQSVSDEKVEEFKRRYGVSDKAMQGAVIDIISKAGVKNGWKNLRGSDAPLDMVTANVQVEQGLMWMGFCAETEGKEFLMDIATDSAKGGEFRSRAVWAYMYRADMQEKRDAIIRFLADDVRPAVQPIFSVYRVAIQTYDKAEGDTQTREAIVAAMSAALAKEENKNAFAEGDKLFAERSKEYAESPQRKAALERINKPPDKLQ